MEDAAMQLLKLHLRLGEFEFSAEGEQDVVERNLSRFLDLVAPTITSINRGKSFAVSDDTLNLNAVLSTDERGVFVLDVHPTGPTHHCQALLLFLKAYRVFKRQQFVPSSDLKFCAEASGIRVGRVDRTMSDNLNQGWAQQSGEKSGTKYGLTESGSKEADRIILTLIAQRAFNQALETEEAEQS